MAKQKQEKKKEFSLTASGYAYDKDLTTLAVKVFPALQALIANQHEIVELARKQAPEQEFFLTAHMTEVAAVEETIAQEYAKHCVKREERKKKRQDKEKEKEKEKAFFNQPQLTDEDSAGISYTYDERLKEDEALLDEMSDRLSPGLPSAKLTTSSPRPAAGREEKGPDVRRIAIGASIKALQALLKRELTEGELALIESQVESYL